MSITITITIDGKEVSGTTVSSQTPSVVTPTTNAIDAGAAPREMELSNMVGFSSPPMEQNIPIVNPGGTSAGAAPNSPPTEH
jgi:hypothetical protein